MTAPAHRVDVGELLDRKLEPIPWRCGEIAADGFVTVITGHATVGKTWLGITLAAGVARGSSRGGIECRKGNSMYLDAENGQWLFQRRLREVDAPRENLELAFSDGFDLSKPTHVEWLKQAVIDADVNLLILDSFGSLALEMEENSRDSVAPVMAHIGQIARDTGAAVIVLHHRSKNGGGAYRGSSAIRDQTDMLFVLGRREGDPEGKTRRYLHADKMRLAEEPEDLWLKFEYADERMSLEPAEPYGGSRRAPKVADNLADKIVANLTGEPEGVSQSELAARLGRCGSDDKNLKAALAKLSLGGQIDRERPGEPWRLTTPQADGGVVGTTPTGEVPPPPSRRRATGVRPMNIQLPDDLIEQIAERIANKLSDTLSQPTSQTPWLTPETAALHLGCRKRRIYDLVSDDRIPVHREGNRLLFRRDELDRWILSGAATFEASAPASCPAADTLLAPPSRSPLSGEVSGRDITSKEGVKDAA